MESSSNAVILYPSPGIGHLVSMVEIGKLIHTHHPTLSVNILIIPTPNKTPDSTGKYIATVPSITFHHLPAITLPPDFSSNFTDLAFGIPELYNPIFHDTLVSISQKSTIKAVILDFFINAAFELCTSFNLPTYYYFTSGASGLCSFLHFPTIHQTVTKSYKDLNIFLDIPGVPKMHSSYMPVELFNRESNSYKNFLKTACNMAKCSGVIANSFLELEKRAAKTLQEGKCVPDGPNPPAYLVGPLIASSNQVDPENECLKWLQTQPSKSVVFLCFGSMGVFKTQQLKQIAIGLERSGKRFLWVVRDPGCENGSASGGAGFGLDEILPEGFIARTKDKGLVVKDWAPQPAILGHEAVGGFVSHCGWNSTLEAVVSGVPMIAWPLYAEQKMNRVYLVEEIKVSLWLEMSADGFVTAEAVEETVRRLMEGEEGRAVRERVSEMSRLAKAAVEDGSSSRVDFMKLTRSWTDDM